MKYPNLQEEKKLWKKGFKRVACLDEAGRGPLAGPVTAAVVAIKPGFRFQVSGFRNIKDSKKLTPERRERFYRLLIKNPVIEWGIGKVSEKIIDKINILEATKLAMKKAIAKLKKKPDFLILDGNFKLDLPILQKSIVKADEKVFSCAAASILAKVSRDRIMEKYHLKYPRYRFNQHKGYPTKLHRRLLKKYVWCKIHRKSFGPVKRLDFLNK
ncbi:ribonuclease HII [Patescibacteria group bacterium]|nr:ribonuclease HII [Patescibacteria group bacterium]